MKNVLKTLGIIALLAVVGMLFSCGGEEDPNAEPVYVTFTGLDSYTGAILNNGMVGNTTSNTSFEDKYAKIYFYSKAGGKSEEATSGKTPIKIVNGKLERVSMVNSSGKQVGIAPDSDSPLFVWVKISSGKTDSITASKADKFKGKENLVFDFQIGNGSWPIKAGDNFFTLSGVQNTPGAITPEDDFFGTYTAAGYTSGVTETVVFTVDGFKISDNENSPADYLDFTIQKWDEATVPNTYNATYPLGYKFSGIITAGQPVESNAIYGSETASGFNQSDITNQTSCHMYIYYSANATTGAITFIRTKFVKDSDTENTTAVSGTGAGGLRVFTKSK